LNGTSTASEGIAITVSVTAKIRATRDFMRKSPIVRLLGGDRRSRMFITETPETPH
jgi:hypothetical protein